MTTILYSAFLLISILPWSSPSEEDLSHTDQCFCQLTGKVEDCCCDIEAVDSLNQKVFPRIMELVKKNYFKFYKVNLERPCPFWPDDGTCSFRDCSVKTCKEDEVPEGVKGYQYTQSQIYKPLRVHKNDKENKAKESCKKDNSTLGYVNVHLSDADKLAFEAWKQYDDAENSFCEPEDELSADSKYVNLLLNPEKFTNYKGQSANRVWYSIYKENCFKVTNPYNEKYVTSSMLSRNGFLKPQWGPNVDEFHNRFDPERTKGQGPTWLKNLYFLYLLVWRAVVKAGPYWQQESFFTANVTDDALVKDSVMDLLMQSRDCPSTFDETLMFTGDPAKSRGLKEEFRKKFRNITRIMDCVGCEKCRLWGKVQTQGIGTALKILFSSHHFEKERVRDTFRLKRSEIVSLFNALGRYSSSIHYVQVFRSLSKGYINMAALTSSENGLLEEWKS